MEVDVIIPLYKPGRSLFTLIERLEKQTVPVRSVILMNTEEKYFEQLVYGTRFLERHKQIRLYHLSKREFDHGGTRHLAVCKSDADIFIMMTQDALPADVHLVEKLTGALKENVAVSYARQLPAEDLSSMEKYMRSFNYPDHSLVKTKEDLPWLGIKTYFCSNVCAAYRREIYEELGGFVRHTIFNEDMIYAASAIRAGYAVAYEAQARVIHSHNYSNSQQLHRNFDLGVSQADHPEVFGGIASESEGKKMVIETAGYLKSAGQAYRIPHLIMQSVCKYAGYWLGKHYRSLPKRMVRGLSMNRDYWIQEERRRDVAGIDARRGYGRAENENK